MSGGDFWSRRKAAVAAEQKAEVQAAEQALLAEEHAKLEELSDQELLVKLELPDPDQMTIGDDFSAFMRQAVPDRLRRRALRRLWVANPVLANLDELLDYGGDFTDAALAVENLQTAYQVGKGMTKHVEELARQARLKEGLEEPEVPPVASPEPTEDETADAAMAFEEAGQGEEPQQEEAHGAYGASEATAQLQETVAPNPGKAQTDPQEEAYPTVSRRRMRFQFET